MKKVDSPFPARDSDGVVPGVSRRNMLAAGVSMAAIPLLEGCSDSISAPSSATQARYTQRPEPSAPNAATTVPITLNINGKPYAVALEPRVTLLDALREHLDLTGTKKGCDHGQCGACTVLIDGRRVNSCLTLAVMANGAEITTIEGLARSEELHPVQAAFIKHDAFQCGYCTPGQICSAVGLIKEGHAKTDDELREEMSGNLCRCGAYSNIVQAVKEAMAQVS